MSARRKSLSLAAVCWLLRSGDAFAAGDAEPPSGSLALVLNAELRSNSTGSRDGLMLVGLSVPLDRLARPSAYRVASSNEAPLLAQAEPARPEADPRSATRPSPGERVSELPLVERSDVRASLRLTPELAQRAVVRTLFAAGYVQAARRLGSASGRARASAALPELRLRAARVTDESLRLSPTSDDPYRYSRTGGTNLVFEARLTWKLDRLVFASEEIGIERLRAEQALRQSALVDRVLKALFAWQSAELKAANAELPEQERMAADLAAFEAELQLDVLTGGWFSEAIRRDDVVSSRGRTPRADGVSRGARSSHQKAGQVGQQAVDNARHACRDTDQTTGPQEAR